MSDHTPIEWTDATWGIVAGCEKVSRECKHCWAIRDSWRLSHNPREQVRNAYAGTVHKVGSKLAWTGLVRPIPERLDWPLKWMAPRKIFVCSQSDLFHADVPDDFIDRAFAVMAMAQRHTFQVLTKRPDRMRAYLAELTWQRLIAACNRAADGGEHRVGAYSLSSIDGRSMKARFVAGEKDAHRALPKPPLRNVHLGFSAGDQETFDERWPHVAELAAAGWKVWVSLEPITGPVDIRAALAAGLAWVVAGGESGSEADPSHPDWFRALRDWCAAAGVAFLFKQWGVFHPSADHDHIAHKCSDRQEAIHVSGKREFRPTEQLRLIAGRAPGWAGMCKLGKKAAGRMLDGRTHDEFPA